MAEAFEFPTKTPLDVVTPTEADASYARLDGTNQPFTAPIEARSEDSEVVVNGIVESGLIGGIDSYTKLMLHLDGTDGSTTITDSSLTPKTVTAVGNAQIKTAQSVFGGASCYFDGSGDYLTTADSDDFFLGTDDWTIDLRLYPTANSNGGIINQWASTSNFVYIYRRSDTALQITASVSGSIVLNKTFSTALVPINTWTHVTIVRSSGSYIVFINGVASEVAYAETDGWQNVSASLEIGKFRNNFGDTFYFTGYMDEIRISKGIARWTTNFTPPTQQYDTWAGGGASPAFVLKSNDVETARIITDGSDGDAIKIKDEDGTTQVSIEQTTGNTTFTGNITANNLSGYNTGDQDLSGYVPYTGATGDVDLGANDLFVGGSLGVGTSSPGAKLDVRGDAIFNEDGGDFDFRIEGDTNANLFKVDAGLDAVSIGTTPLTNTRLSVASGGTNRHLTEYGYKSSQTINVTDADETTEIHFNTLCESSVTGTYKVNEVRGLGGSVIVYTDTSYTYGMTGSIYMNPATPKSHFRCFGISSGIALNSHTVTGYASSLEVTMPSVTTGTIGSAYGLNIKGFTMSGAGTITNYYGGIITPSNVGASGTIGTAYGLYIGDFGVSTAGTTRYSLYTLGGGVVFNDNGTDSDFRIEGDADANLFFLDASTDRIGVGTATPGVKLDVYDATSATFRTSSGTRSIKLNSYASDWNYNTSLGAPYVFGTQDNNQVLFYQNNSERMRIQTGGNVGIGETSPVAKLHVDTTAVGTIGQIIRGQASQTADLQEWQISGGTVVSRVDKNGYFHQGYEMVWSETKTIGSTAGDYVELGTALNKSNGSNIEIDVSWYTGNNAESRKYIIPYAYNAVTGWRRVAPIAEYSGYASPIDLECVSSSSNTLFRLRNRIATYTPGANRIKVTYKITSSTLLTGSLSDVWTASTTTGNATSKLNPYPYAVIRQRNGELHIANNSNTSGYSRIVTQESATEAGSGASGVRIYNTGKFRSDGSLGNIGGEIFGTTVLVPNTVNDYCEFWTIVTPSHTCSTEIWTSVRQGGYAVTKRYMVQHDYNATNGQWQKLIPISTSGAYSGNDQDLEIKIATGTSTLRVRRVSGTTTSATMYVGMMVGASNDQITVTSINNTGSTTAPTVAFEPTVISQSAGKLGVGGLGADRPTSMLDVNGDIETTSTGNFYFGDPSTDGSWRVVRSGDGLAFERRESSSWVQKNLIAA